MMTVPTRNLLVLMLASCLCGGMGTLVHKGWVPVDPVETVQSWPGCEIPYEIEQGGNMDTTRKEAVEAGMAMWKEALPGINFRARTSRDEQYVRFVGGADSGATSPLGMYLGMVHTVSVGGWCNAACVAREIAHVMGSSHVGFNDLFAAVHEEADALYNVTGSGGTTSISSTDRKAMRFLYNNCRRPDGNPKCVASVANRSAVVEVNRPTAVTFVAVAGLLTSVQLMSSNGHGASLQPGLPLGAQGYTMKQGKGWLHHTGAQVNFVPRTLGTHVLAARFETSSGGHTTCEVEVKVVERPTTPMLRWSRGGCVNAQHLGDLPTPGQTLDSCYAKCIATPNCTDFSIGVQPDTEGKCWLFKGHCTNNDDPGYDTYTSVSPSLRWVRGGCLPDVHPIQTEEGGHTKESCYNLCLSKEGCVDFAIGTLGVHKGVCWIYPGHCTMLTDTAYDMYTVEEPPITRWDHGGCADAPTLGQGEGGHSVQSCRARCVRTPGCVDYAVGRRGAAVGMCWMFAAPCTQTQDYQYNTYTL